MTGTVVKRLSALSEYPYESLIPPDGELGLRDRQTILGLYAISSDDFVRPINRSVVWDEGKRPNLILGDTFWNVLTLKAGVTPIPYNFVSATDVKVAIVSEDHTAAYSSSTVLTRSLDGANWTLGHLSVLIPSSITIEASSAVKKITHAEIEIQVTIDNNSYTWFAPVRLIPGYVS